MKRRAEESNPPHPVSSSPPPTHRDLISSRLIMLLFFGPNLFTEEMRNTLTQHRNSLSSVCANTHRGRKTHVWIFTQCTHTLRHTRACLNAHVGGRKTHRRALTYKREINTTIKRCVFITQPFLVSLRLLSSISHTHTHTYVCIPCWKPISSSVSRGEQDNDSQIPPVSIFLP